jgi:hypothetical protein
MSGAEIDRLCTDWLRHNYGEAMARRYTPHALVFPMWNPPELNAALDTLRQVLGMAFRPDECFADSEYHEARRKLRLWEERPEIPEAFIKAFAGTPEPR